MFSAAIASATEQSIHRTAAARDITAAAATRNYAARADRSNESRAAADAITGITGSAAKYAGHAACGTEPATAQLRNQREPFASALAARHHLS